MFGRKVLCNGAQQCILLYCCGSKISATFSATAMGSLLRIWKTIPMPKNAAVGCDGKVTWTVGGKKKTGKLSGTSRVRVQVSAWTAQFTDETGQTRRVSTRTSNRSAAEKILAKHEAEIDRIKSGVVTRSELLRSQTRHATLEDMLEQFRTKMIAEGSSVRHVANTQRQILSFFDEAGITSVDKLLREVVEKWVATEIQSKVRSPRTINKYIGCIKAFVQYLTDLKVLLSNPLKQITKLNEQVDLRKRRRALTIEEVERLLKVATIP